MTDRKPWSADGAPYCAGHQHLSISTLSESARRQAPVSLKLART